MKFSRINRLSVPEEIIADIKQKIIDGELRPGDKLPSENKLATMFGVGRGTIREAIKVMIFLGIITRNNNRATYVSNTAVEKVLMRNVLESFSEHRDTLEMIEVRKIIEPEAAALAAERKEDHLIEKLEYEYQKMLNTKDDDVEAFIRHDNLFHECIFSGTGNRMIVDLMKSIHNAMQNSQASVIQSSSQIKPRSLKFHEAVLEAIKSGSREKAKELMLDHILDVEKEMFEIYKHEKEYIGQEL